MAADSEDIVEVEANNYAIDTKQCDEQKRKFIKDLKQHPALWSTTSVEYKNKSMKLKASEELTRKYDIDVVCMKSIIHGLRGSLTREIRKAKEDKDS